MSSEKLKGLEIYKIQFCQVTFYQLKYMKKKRKKNAKENELISHLKL